MARSEVTIMGMIEDHKNPSWFNVARMFDDSNDKPFIVRRHVMRPLSDKPRYVTIFDPCILLCPKMIYVADTVRVDSFTKLEGGDGIALGDYVHIASFVSLNIGGGRLIMESGSACSSGVRIVTGSNVPADDHSRSCSAVHPLAVATRSAVTIKRNAIIFCNAVILPGVTIGEGAVVAAGAIVNRDVPDRETWGGVPARRLK
jgi:acetyltransferase-like isoleucine patch superfamily enzyme